MHKELVGVVLVGLLTFAAAAAAEGEDDKASVDQMQLKEDKGKLFIQSYSTTTWTYLSSITSTVPFTCYFTQNANAPKACQGRRLNRARMINFQQDESDIDIFLSSGEGRTVAEKEEPREEVMGVEDKGKIFFTVWRTSSTTVTVTTSITNRSISVSASIMCTYSGISFNLC